MKKILVSILIVFMATSCLKDEAFNREYDGFVPVERNDFWETSTPEKEGMDVDFIQKAYALVFSDTRYVMARSLLVIKNGKLVAEAYPNNKNDINAIYNIQSCTKSYTSILTGIALKEGFIDSLQEKLYSVYPESFDADTRKQNITLSNALTMRTGLEFDNGEHTLYLYQNQENSTKLVLSQDYLYAPGTVVNYNDGAPHLVSKFIEERAGKSLAEFANEKLFSPLGITDWKWEAAADGTTYGAFSLYLKPRDIAKTGLLLLNHGQWNGQTIIDSTYLSEAIKTQVSTNFHSEPYGYYFWIMPAFKGYAALGHGGQFLFVVPEKELVVVYTSWPYTGDEFFDQRNDLISLIYESCN